ncbi:ADP-dependent glucokinase/phosphofructokinase [Chelativorans sp. M5D2P16]|uniref:ADP-dependent glucokinase/phosphofructokinase n=1 Tax=Chelativorans sp. M5D2P16 TaxID=3095678 RepID=UPI002ACA5751|nr:ADP-dependent glucokinase/phosphofructokinase [Chelativorans sp. M5D2P16]MDZ5698664.1 ADP-dependent glucokinase/phosphofructokinase [Chelativorans sp. M5D2P16]
MLSNCVNKVQKVSRREVEVSGASWRSRYEALLRRFPDVASSARLTICCTSSCLDVSLFLRELPDPRSIQNPDAAKFLDQIVTRAQSGVGGEVVVNWPGGGTWLKTAAPVTCSWGGTGPHASMALAALGAPAVNALGARGELVLSRIPAGVLLAENGRLVRSGGAVRRHGESAEVFIIEFSAGEVCGGKTLPRSSRIIVRFGDIGIEDDADFGELTARLAHYAGAGLIGGFQCVSDHQLRDEYARLSSMSSGWIAAGVPFVHLELAGYESSELCEQALRALRGSYNSLGMSLSEFKLYFGGSDFSGALCRLASSLGLRRLAVHADEWAAAVTLDDPEVEIEALMSGCLLASARASSGAHGFPKVLPADAHFAKLPFAERQELGEWAFVSCPSPYLPSPATTLGLGDTFTAGCLLVLGGHAEIPSVSRDAGSELG